MEVGSILYTFTIMSTKENKKKMVKIWPWHKGNDSFCFQSMFISEGRAEKKVVSFISLKIKDDSGNTEE